MQGHIIKPKPLSKVYISSSNSDKASHIAELLNELDLKPILGQRNEAGSAAGWRVLADIYNQNLQKIRESDLFLAILDDNSTDKADVCVEMGLAYASQIPVLGLITSAELRASPMVIGMCRGDDQVAYSIEGLMHLVKEHIKITNAALESVE